MTDRFEEHLSRLGGPRPIDPLFREQLERAIVEGDASAGEVSPPQWGIDDPRAMAPSFRARLERTVVKGRPPRSISRWLAAGIAAALVASAAVVTTERLNAPRTQQAFPGATPQDLAVPKPRPPVIPHGPDTLRGFSSAGDFLRYVRGEALEITGPYGVNGGSDGFGFLGGDVLGPPAAAPGVPTSGGSTTGGSTGGGGLPVTAPAPAQLAYTYGEQFSTTNNQEEGVDEPDIAKTDGRRLVTINATKLSVLDVATTPRLRGSLKIENATGAFLAGDRVILFSTQFGAPPGALRATHVIDRNWTKVTVVDISIPATPRVVSSFDIEGSYVGARLAGGVVRLIVQSGSLGPAPIRPATYTKAAQDSAEAKNKRAVRRSVVGDWVPHYLIERRGKGPVTGHVHGWQQVSRPPDRGGVGMLTILTIDPANPRPDNALSVVGSGEIVYSTADNLYVTSNRFEDVLASSSGRFVRDPVTRIHKFDITDPRLARYVGSGDVPGYLLNQFSMSEHLGYLRAASTLDPTWALGARPRTSHSQVTVLADKGGQLVAIGSVGNLARGEKIYSVRFIGSMGYVVTFRQIDPLFVIDIRKPSRPKVLGKLKVSGYSGYLHPVSDTLLIGVGRAVKANEPTGLQISLFDVSDPAKPERLSVRTIGIYGWSEVEQDHHAFLYWGPKRLMVIPATILDSTNSKSQFVGALALTVSRSGGLSAPDRLTHVGRPHVAEFLQPIRRSLVLGDRLVTISDNGVLFSDLDSFADLSWVPLS